MTPVDERTAISRLLDRLNFGPAPGELDRRVPRGFTATLDELLTPAAPVVLPDLGPLPEKSGKKGEKNSAEKGAAKEAKDLRARQEATAVSWWLDRMVTEPTATERLTWFWHGHFATSAQKVKYPALMLRQIDLFRRQGMGSFSDLAEAVLVDPAMLIWLDGRRNTAEAPNENLSREFMELFALGVGNYTEDDVREGARALTGWTVSKDGNAELATKKQDGGEKTLLGVTAAHDVRSFAATVLANPESAPYVAGRLWERLVSDTAPPGEVLDRLTAACGPGRDVRALVRAIALEPAFIDSASAVVKQPVEWGVGLMRALGLRPSTMDAETAKGLTGGLRGMGQVPLRPPSVGGWPSGQAWLNTSAGLSRLRLAQLLASKAELGGLRGTAEPERPDAVGLLLGVPAWSDRSRAALSTVAGDPMQLVAAAACSPEYVVSG
ncbi:hypothetical protein CFN78_20740 [Amycolatopsis antarctica]|uniref:DUF1800 domain-containing protein n=1 Tax=Amycolatopsis antarctica TaxID=1854586 RepID=A0A263CYJ9_9PSEU|nr:DUF1800 domain-containing protein [Amycolatopsis antarctica]OZM71232.1 hypothetical protein CFN78_20740 [Amycolatopsis antarctica]